MSYVLQIWWKYQSGHLVDPILHHAHYDLPLFWTNVLENIIR